MKKERSLHNILVTVDPPQGLCARISARIELAKRRAAQLRAGLFGAVALVCGTVLVPALEYTSSQLYASGFYEYLSLISSDNSLVFTYWREFGLSLIESLPSLALLLVLPTVVALVWSLARLVKNIRTGFKYAV